MKKIMLFGILAMFAGMTELAVAHDYGAGWNHPGKGMGRMVEGRHWMTGKVEGVDHKTGWLKVKTDEGTLNVHFAPDSIKDLKDGDTITVHLGYTKGAEPKNGKMMEEKKKEEKPMDGKTPK